MAKKVIKTSSELQTTSKIKISSLIGEDTVRFSFKYLDLSHGKFQVKHRNGEYIHKLADRLKHYSSMNIREQLLSSKSKSTRFHPIDWDGTTEHDGFTCLNEELRALDGYEIEVEQKIYGRIHGFILGNIFFIVWLDPDHNLYK